MQNIDSCIFASKADPFGPFPHLRGLGLKNNHLNVFLNWIGPYVQQNIYINASNNRIRTLPVCISQMNFLEPLLLDKNPLEPPYDFIMDRARAIKTPYSHPHNRDSGPPRMYFIRNMVKLWDAFPTNLLAFLTANRLHGN